MDLWTTIILALAGITILLTALAERIRGGWLGAYIPRGTTGARIARALVWTLIAAAWTLGSPLVAGATLIGAYVAVLNSHRDSWDIGFDHGSPWADALVMTGLGLIRYALTAGPLLMWLWSPAGMLSLGVSLAHPAVYWLARRYEPPRPSWAPSMLDSPTAYAELAWGAAQGAAVVAAILAA